MARPPTWLEISGSTPEWPSWRWYGRYYPAPRGSYVGSLFGCDVVAKDEKENEMTTLNEVFTVFHKFNELQKAAGKGFNRLMVYGDGSGRVEDGNDDEVVSFDSFTDALESIQREIDLQTPEWKVGTSGFRSSFFLVHERFGLRYPVGAGLPPSQAEAMVNQLVKLANRDMPKGWVLPIGTTVKFTDDFDNEHDGIIVMRDASEEYDNKKNLYLVNFTDPDDTNKNYQCHNQEWASADQVKVQPHDPMMRLALLQLASAYAIDISKMGLLI